MRGFAVALAGVLGFGACTRPSTIQPRVPPNHIPECPHDPSFVAIQLDTQVIVQTQLLGPGITSDIPEYHDCQRFVVRGPTGLRYDSLFAVFRTGSRLQATPQASPQAVPATEILAWGDYGQLGLSRGQNCLYMWRSVGPPPGPPQWQARMIHTADWGKDGELKCNRPIQVELLPPGTSLVVAETLRGLPTGAFPHVARWGWSRSDSVQTINLDCGPAWCEVLPPGVGPTRSYYEELALHGPPPSGPQAIIHRYRVSGWYDEQLLAYDPFPDDSTNLPVPTGILGRFFPHFELGTKTSFRPQPPDKIWTLVGYAALLVPTDEDTTHIRKYERVYGLKRTSETAHFEDMNKIGFCQGSRRACEVPDTVKACPDDDATEPLEWWARVDAPDGTFKVRCVTRRGHDEAEVPATARWRWAINDEGSWERCVQGCCEMIGES